MADWTKVYILLKRPQHFSAYCEVVWNQAAASLVQVYLLGSVLCMELSTLHTGLFRQNLNLGVAGKSRQSFHFYGRRSFLFKLAKKACQGSFGDPEPEEIRSLIHPLFLDQFATTQVVLRNESLLRRCTHHPSPYFVGRPLCSKVGDGRY